MTNKEIEDYLAECGYEVVEFRTIGQGSMTLYFNWQKQAVVTENSLGVKKLLLEVDSDGKADIL